MSETPALPKLAVDSKDVQYVKYLIQEQLDAPHVRILECLDAASVNQANVFADFCKSMEPKNVIHFFAPINQLTQPLSDILVRGVRINPRKGLKITADHITLDEKTDRAQDAIQIVHCLVALGSTQNWQRINAETDDNSFETSIPTCENLLPQYHSICTSPTRQEFYVFNPHQIRTLHIVTISAGETLEKGPEMDKRCDLCHDREATVYCANCKVKLCDECDENSHKYNPVLQSHERIPMKEAITSMECCPFHPKNRVEHFCLECGLPVCFECKLQGNHSQGALAKHELIPIKEAYASALRESENEAREYGRRRRAIKRKLADAELRLKDVAENSKAVEAKIMKLAQEAIASLKAQAGERALRIRSAQVELQRKLDELEQNAQFLEDHRELSNPVSFIQAYTMFKEQIRAEYYDDDDLPSDLYVQGDLAIVGGIEIKPRQLTKLPEGVVKRDLDFEEKKQDIRYTDMSTTATSTSTVTQDSVTPSSYYTGTTETTSTTSKHAHKTKLSSMALRKARKMQGPLPFEPFAGSRVITDPDQARILYLCMPFKSTPQTHLLYSTERDGRSILRMHQLIDNVGITAVLVKRGAHVFGGFAANKWNNESNPVVDNSSTFLFSITHDTFIPFRAKAIDACYMLAGKDYLSFGVRDLRLENDFQNCSSCLENSFTCGFEEGSKEAKTFLAGSEKFKAEFVEVWGFFTNK